MNNFIFYFFFVIISKKINEQLKNNDQNVVLIFSLLEKFNTIHLFENKFPPIKIFCYNLSHLWRPDNSFIKKYMYFPDSIEFQYNIEIEMYKELLLSPILTNNPNEADFFYIPIYPFALWIHEHLKLTYPFNRLDFKNLISELRAFGPWFDLKDGADHIMVSGWDLSIIGKNFMNDVLNSKILFCTCNPDLNYYWKPSELNIRFINLPYISYYPKYPFEQIDWMKKRENKVFLAQSLTFVPHAKSLRMKLIDIIKKVKNHNFINFTRQNYGNYLSQLPLHYMNSDFCLCPRGDTPSAKRNFDAVHFGCIPVYISDHLTFPFSGFLLNYSKFSIHIPEKDISLLPNLLENYSQKKILEMRLELKKSAKLFLFRLGEAPRIGEGFWATSWMWYIRYIYLQQFDFKFLQKVKNTSFVSFFTKT